MRLTVLDEVTWDGREIPGDRTVGLLRALVEAGPAGLSEERLVDEVWPDDPPANPRKALQVVVSRARTATAQTAIERTRRGYRLTLGNAEVDAWALRPEGLRLAQEGCHAEALPLLERAVAGGGADDEIMVALLHALAAVKGLPVALARYEGYRQHLAETLGIDPSSALKALHAELLAGDAPVRTGLRYDVDRLVGRDADLAALRVLVRSHRVVSIVGTGGLGKTRLANLVAREAEQPVVHVVELAGVASPAGVAIAVADAVGVRDSASVRISSVRQADVFARLVEAIGTVATLLVLDNCEHLIEAAADLVSVLVSRTPRLTVLTTTRIPLGLPAERTYLLPELSLDDAAALFVERAVAARPGAIVDDAEVRSLVARLDGLPLAVELAAAKVRSMSVVEITRRLDNRFALLRGGSRVAPERHQTLLAVIDWSWNLLSEEQRVALRRLAVFRDGFSLDGASALLGAPADEVVNGLVEHSLVVVRESTQVRYRLLETVREFGRMQLVDAGDDGLAEERLRGWAVRLSTYVSERLYTAEQVPMVTLVRTEEGNLVDVLRRAIVDADVATAAVLYSTLAIFWMIEGAHVKVLNLSPQVIELIVSAPTPTWPGLTPRLADAVRIALALSTTNDMIFRGGPVEGPALERLRELGPGDNPQVAATVRVLVETRGGSTVDGYPQRLLDLAEDPDPLVARAALLWLSHTYENLGDLPAARAASRRAIALSDDDQGPWMRAILSAGLSGLALHQGDFAEAAHYAHAALPALAALGAFEDHAQTRAALALIALHQGELDEAEKIFDEVAVEEAAQSLFGALMVVLGGRAELLLARGRVDEGLRAYRDALTAISGRSMPELPVQPGLEPWVMFPQAAVVAAHVRHGRRAQADRDELLRKLRRVTGGEGFLDVPMVGCALFALGVWEAAFGTAARGGELLSYADRFAFSRMAPTFDWAWATSLVAPAAIPPGSPLDLRDALQAVLDALA